MLQPEYFVEKEETVSLEEQGGTIEERIEDLLKLKDVNDDGFNPVNFRAAVEHVTDKKQKEKAKGLFDLFTEDMTKALIAVIQNGPMKQSDVPSKDGMKELVKLGMMAEVAGEGGKDKMAAATMVAVDLGNVAGVESPEKDEDDKDD